jgi:uncharacterized protein (TIGR03435 family)
MAQAPRFEVASAKALPGELHGGGFDVTPVGIAFHGYPLGFLIRWAYGLHANQAFETAGPDWLEPGLGCVRFDIEAKTDHPVPVEQLRLMLRTLLAERLNLSLHREMRNMTVAAIRAAKNGPNLHPSEMEEMTVTAEGELFHFRGALLSRLDEWLYQFVPYLVVDETGLPGRYDFDLDVAKYQDLATHGPGGRSDMTTGVNKALEPLGLKLELQRRPVEVLVIDHADKTPTEN